MFIYVNSFVIFGNAIRFGIHVADVSLIFENVVK